MSASRDHDRASAGAAARRGRDRGRVGAGGRRPRSAAAASALHHDALIEGKLPYALALVLFLVAWQAMIAAMMVPSSLPLVRLFAAAAAGQPRPRAAMAAFLGGYALVWTAFGVARVRRRHDGPRDRRPHAVAAAATSG